MNSTYSLANNPFALMMEPEAVFAAIERSERLARLSSRICRPLDKPLIAKTDDDAAAFDRDVDSAPELPFESEDERSTGFAGLIG